MPSLMPYEKQHQSRSRKVRRDPKCSMRKNTRDFKMDPKSMRIILKTDFKLSSLKLKKHQNFTVLQQQKRAGFHRNLLKSGVQKDEIVFFSDQYSLLLKSSIHKTTECWTDTQGTLLKTCLPFITTGSQHLSWFGL